jgi:hypothetical protein
MNTNKPDLDALLRELQLTTVRELLDKIKSGEATAAHLAVARGILNDSGIQTTTTSATNKLLELVKDPLPFDEEEVA